MKRDPPWNEERIKTEKGEQVFVWVAQGDSLFVRLHTFKCSFCLFVSKKWRFSKIKMTLFYNIWKLWLNKCSFWERKKNTNLKCFFLFFDQPSFRLERFECCEHLPPSFWLLSSNYTVPTLWVPPMCSMQKHLNSSKDGISIMTLHNWGGFWEKQREKRWQ